MKILSYTHVFSNIVFISLLLSACREKAVDNVPIKDIIEEKRKPRLLEPQELSRLIDAGTAPIIIEISKADDFAEAHVPSARNVWRPDYENNVDFEYEGMRASRTKMEELLSKLGILPEDHLVLYDENGNCDAFRFMWILDIYGHKNISIMNGGKLAWKLEGMPTSKVTMMPVPTDYHFSTNIENHQHLATFEEVIAALGDTNVILLDTREPEEYAGAPYIDKGKVNPWKSGAYTFGRIPGAKHFNWSEAVELDVDHRLKSLRAIRWNFEQAGITADKKIITYCQSGVRSSHTTFVLTEILGYPNVKNYDGSWIEWSYHYSKLHDVTIDRNLTEVQHNEQLRKLQMQVKKDME